MKKWILLCFLSVMASPAFGQDWGNALVTDRPDTAESSLTVGKNRFQLETSTAFDHNRNAGVTTQTFSFPTLLRYGFLDQAEFRVEGNLFQSQSATGSARANGITDLDFGLKWHLLDTEGLRPSFGLLAHLTVPTGKKGFSGEGYVPTFKTLIEWDLPRDFSLGMNLGFDVSVQDTVGDKFARFLYAVAFGIPSPILTEQLRFFTGASGIIPTVSGKSEQHSVEGGVTFLYTPNLQFDTFVTAGLNRNTTDIGTGLGLSWRF